MDHQFVFLQTIPYDRGYYRKLNQTR
uniref:Uncharacterized protein n=1 Tax=Tetranychus urticae TaxID=32264 RepID=T1KT18_TETUR